jgi:hypothetical protein
LSTIKFFQKNQVPFVFSPLFKLKPSIMNLFKLTFLFVLAISIISCDNDDDMKPDCSQSDWTGTYEGTIDCNGSEEDVTVTITASGSDDIIIVYESTTLTTEYDPFTPDNCDLDVMESDQGVTLTVDATLDGDDLTIIEELSSTVVLYTCTITAQRQ